MDIKAALSILEDALNRCRQEDMRNAEVYTALNYLQLSANIAWPFEQFRNALHSYSNNRLEEEARWQMMNASLNAIRRAVSPND